MPLDVAHWPDSLRTLRSMRLATLWRITRRDGGVLLFTDHNAQLEYGGEAFAPAGGFDATARRKQDALRDQGLDIQGVVTSDAITTDDLRSGSYRDATVQEFQVDWRYPHATPMLSAVYRIGSVRWDGEVWSAELAGLASRLDQRIGDVSGRTCRHTLGDPGCAVALGEYVYNDVEVNGVTDRRNFDAFDAGIPGSLGDDWFALGTITWISGANAGHRSEVRSYTDTGRAFELQEETPFDIAASDVFEVTPGCDRLRTTCRDKFSNVLNYGGDPYIPGTDQTLQTPTS